jgi:hypothetical protein
MEQKQALTRHWPTDKVAWDIQSPEKLPGLRDFVTGNTNGLKQGLIRFRLKIFGKHTP